MHCWLVRGETEARGHSLTHPGPHRWRWEKNPALLSPILRLCCPKKPHCSNEPAIHPTGRRIWEQCHISSTQRSHSLAPHPLFPPISHFQISDWLGIPNAPFHVPPTSHQTRTGHFDPVLMMRNSFVCAAALLTVAGEIHRETWDCRWSLCDFGSRCSPEILCPKLQRPPAGQSCSLLS